jgi:hypothetical protein
MAIETSIKLREVFRPDVERLERLLKRDLSAWKGAMEPNVRNRESCTGSKR